MKKSFIVLLMFVSQTLISLSQEPQGFICCDRTEINYELTDSCCVLVTVFNEDCKQLGIDKVLVQKYDNQLNEFVTVYVATDTFYLSTKVCPDIGETSVIIRIRITLDYNDDIAACISDNWIEGRTQYTDTISVDNCCDCPSSRQNWIKYSLYKSRDCPDNGCKVNLLDFDIPAEYSCYTNYKLKWNDGTPISSMKSIANDPLYTESKCIPNQKSLILHVYLYKNGESEPACSITKIFQCRDDLPSIDTTENVCTPDCFNDAWETPRLETIEVPEGSGCHADVLYTYRKACPPTNYQDLQVLQITTEGCYINLTNKEIYQKAVIGLIKLNPMGFKPELNTIGCDTTWRVVKTDCWRNLYEYVPPDFTINNLFGYIKVVYQQCDTGQCCIQKYVVCRDSSENLIVTPTEFIPSNNPESCVFIEELEGTLMPVKGPYGTIIGVFYPDICYSSCDWVTIHKGPFIIHGKVSIENVDYNMVDGNKLKIDCSNNSSCKLRIEYFNLQGSLINTINKTIYGNENEIDISSYINQNGIFIYRIYLNDNLYKTGKFIK